MSDPRAGPANNPLRAAVWMIGAIGCFSAMAIAGRAAAPNHDTFEIMLYRSLVGILVVLAIAAWAGTLGEVSARRLPLHLVRNLCHFTGQNLWFYAITVAPLAQVFALEFTAPLWGMFLAVIVLGEALTMRRMFWALVGFAGILLVARPGAAGLDSGTITAGLAAIGFAASAVFTRLLTRNESITSILFWLTVMQAVFGLVAAGHDGQIALPTADGASWLLVIGLAGLLAHFCLTKALALAPAAVIMPVDFVRLPLIALIGMAFYAEPVEWQVMAGAVVIFGASYAMILGERRRRQPPDRPAAAPDGT